MTGGTIATMVVAGGAILAMLILGTLLLLDLRKIARAEEKKAKAMLDTARARSRQIVEKIGRDQ